VLKIIKTLGYCYDGCGWTECEYKYRDEASPNRPQSTCGLFFDLPLEVGGRSLDICNFVYGSNYENEP